MRISTPGILAAAVVLCAASLPAQIMITRTVVVGPIADTADGKSRFPQPRFFIEASRGYGSSEDNQAWNIKMGGMLQISPWGGRSVLVGLFGHELTSNPYNSIGYNPRGALRDENALFADLFAAYEHFFDDLSRPTPQTSNVISVGIRVTSSEVF